MGLTEFLGSRLALLILLSTVVIGLVVALVLLWRSKRREFATPLERATFSTLHTVSLAAPFLREGLSKQSAAFALPYLRTLLETCALTMTNDKTADVLAWDGESDHHIPDVMEEARKVLATGRQQVASHTQIDCGRSDCPARGLVVSPVEVEGRIVGTLGALTEAPPGPVLLRAAAQVARYVSSQLELAELDESRSRLAHAEVRALRAQISPHFIYNALNTIGSLTRTDPDQARKLLHEFADFTRYSFRGAGQYTTLKDELKNIERYVTIEMARYEWLRVHLRIEPEVLPVVVPFLAVQPLVENAIRHGLANKPGGGSVVLTASNEGAECVITVEDDGIGMDPDRLRENLADAHLSGAHVGMGNIDDRMRSTFGHDYGLVVDTALGAGMKVTLRVPKFRAGIRA